MSTFSSSDIDINNPDDKRNKRRVVHKLRFDGNENIAVCIKTERDDLIRSIKKTKKAKH